MSKLTDKEIRCALMTYLTELSPKAVLEELRVHNGNAVADVVAINDCAHCYEIKGETDEIRRILKQGAFYDQVFPRITLVTTLNHLTSASRLAPQHWGIILAEHGRRGPALRQHRQATESSAFDKRLALLTLWRSELVDLCNVRELKAEKLSRAKLSDLIAEDSEANDVSRMIGQLLAQRQMKSGWPKAI